MPPVRRSAQVGTSAAGHCWSVRQVSVNRGSGSRRHYAAHQWYHSSVRPLAAGRHVKAGATPGRHVAVPAVRFSARQSTARQPQVYRTRRRITVRVFVGANTALPPARYQRHPRTGCRPPAGIAPSGCPAFPPVNARPARTSNAVHQVYAGMPVIHPEPQRQQNRTPDTTSRRRMEGHAQRERATTGTAHRLPPPRQHTGTEGPPPRHT